MATAPTIRVSATAVEAPAVPQCVLALDQSNTTALTVTGSATVNMSCGMASNASGSTSLEADGGAVVVPSLSAVGTVYGSAYDPDKTTVNNGIAPVPDPYAGLPMPADLATQCSGASFATSKSHASVTLSPGCYTGLSVQGAMNLNPGVYVIDGGSVSIGASGSLIGSGVTLIFTNSDPTSSNIGNFVGNGNGFVDLTASSSGTYEGILMYQDARAQPSNATNFFLTGNNGTDSSGKSILSQYQGAIYTPSTYTTFSGNSSISTPCMQIVAMQVSFTGNTTVQNKCDPGSGASAFSGAGSSVKLVA